MAYGTYVNAFVYISRKDPRRPNRSYKDMRQLRFLTKPKCFPEGQYRHFYIVKGHRLP